MVDDPDPSPSQPPTTTAPDCRSSKQLKVTGGTDAASGGGRGAAAAAAGGIPGADACLLPRAGRRRAPSASAERPDAYSALVRALLSSAAVSASPPTRVSCTLTVSAAATNAYNTLHGGAVAAVGMACARAAAGDKEMFLGELSTAYLAAARLDSEVDVEAQILRKGRSVVVTTIEFRLKDTEALLHISSHLLHHACGKPMNDPVVYGHCVLFTVPELYCV